MADFRIMPVFYREDPSMNQERGVFTPGDAPSDDADLPPLARVQKKAQSGDIYDRQMVVQKILEVFRTGPITALVDDYREIMDILSKLADEDEADVRADLIEQIPHIAFQATKCAKRLPVLENIVGEYLLPIVVRNLKTNNKRVRLKVYTVLSELMQHGFVTKELVETQVCPAILELSNIDSDVDFILCAINLMCRVAPFLGQELTENILLQRFSCLCANQLFYVRKVCVSHIAHFCAVVGREAYEQVLLPCYIRLCSDDSCNVRQACAEVIMSVACVCPSEARKNILTPVYANLLQDQNRFVRISAFEKLGPFISTFAEPSITNLTYNSVGELVVITANEIEFRVRTPSLLELSFSRGKDVVDAFALVGDMNEIDDEPKNVTINITDDFANSNNEENNINMNNFFNYLPSSEGFNSEDYTFKNSTFDFLFGDSSETKETTDDEDKCDNVELDNNLDFFNSMYKRDLNKDTDDHEYEENCVANVCHDEFIKEIVETVKNAVLNYRNPEPDCAHKDVNNVICDTNNQCDNLNSEIEKISDELENINIVDSSYNTANSDQESDNVKKSLRSAEENNETENLLSGAEENNKIENSLSGAKENIKIENSSSSADEYNKLENPLNSTAENNKIKNPSNSSTVENNKKENASSSADENLLLFNSYNYWYINPELPLDPNIVDVGRSETDDDSFLSQQLDFKTYSDQTFAVGENNMEKMPNNQQLSTEESKQDIVPQVLINHFVSMTNPTLARGTYEGILWDCAYFLPAVALTLGGKNWHLLQSTLEALAADVQYKVRKTVASSLHELAFIVGTEIATNSLTPIFDGFIKDLDEVRIAVVEHLAQFLQLIQPSKRIMYLPKLAAFLQTDNEWNWRFREMFARQLLLTIPLFKPVKAARHFAIFAERILCDKVAAVRQVGLLLLTQLVEYISSDRGRTSRLLVLFAERFALSKKWQKRQTYALLCSELLCSNALSPELFASEMLPHLLDLSWDPVPNIRLVVARTIANHILTNEYFFNPNNQHFDGLETVLKRLQVDKDRDVRNSAVFNNSPSTS